MRPIVWRVACGVLALSAGALFWLAFTQFDTPPPGAGSDVGSYEDAVMRDARLSVVFGLAGCFILLGSFACLDAARRQAVAQAATHGP